MVTMPAPAKLLSGAQTGADRADLDWAIFRDVPHGGWCPKGRKAEGGKLSRCRTFFISKTSMND